MVMSNQNFWGKIKFTQKLQCISILWMELNKQTEYHIIEFLWMYFNGKRIENFIKNTKHIESITNHTRRYVSSFNTKFKNTN